MQTLSDECLKNCVNFQCSNFKTHDVVSSGRFLMVSIEILDHAHDLILFDQSISVKNNY